MELIKSSECLRYSIVLEKDTSGRYLVKHKTKGMADYAVSSFMDLKTANIIFDSQLMALEGH